MPRAFRLAALPVLLAGGCAPAVTLQAPPPVASEAWSGEATPAAPAATPLAALLAAPELERLTRQALDRNADIRIAAARVAQAQALLKGARRAGLPEVSLAGGGSRRFGNGGASALDFTEGFARLDVALDVDLFGRLSAEKRAALARADAAGLEREAVALAVEADVALAYVQGAALARRIAILEANIARAVGLDRIVRLRAAQGDATRVDQGLQAIRLLNLRERGSRLREALDQTRTALAILTGAEAPGFALTPAELEALTIPALAPPPPRALLAARPDLRATEALIAAANGDVGAARAAFLPRLSLSLEGLLAGATGSPLGQSVSVGSSILAPIFSRGRLESALGFATGAQAEAVERYRQRLLAALAEVEDARGADRRSQERARLLEAIVEEARLTARLANVRYIEGEEDLLSVLDAQTSLSDAEDAQALGWQERLFAQIALYRAMGGHQPAGLAAAR